MFPASQGNGAQRGSEAVGERIGVPVERFRFRSGRMKRRRSGSRTGRSGSILGLRIQKIEIYLRKKIPIYLPRTSRQNRHRLDDLRRI